MTFYKVTLITGKEIITDTDPSRIIGWLQVNVYNSGLTKTGTLLVNGACAVFAEIVQ